MIGCQHLSTGKAGYGLGHLDLSVKEKTFRANKKARKREPWENIK